MRCFDTEDAPNKHTTTHRVLLAAIAAGCYLWFPQQETHSFLRILSKCKFFVLHAAHGSQLKPWFEKSLFYSNRFFWDCGEFHRILWDNTKQASLQMLQVLTKVLKCHLSGATNPKMLVEGLVVNSKHYLLGVFHGCQHALNRLSMNSTRFLWTSVTATKRAFFEMFQGHFLYSKCCMSDAVAMFRMKSKELDNHSLSLNSTLVLVDEPFCVRVSLGRVDNISPCTWESKLREHASSAQAACGGRGEPAEVIDGGNGGDEECHDAGRVDYNPRSGLPRALDSMYSPPHPRGGQSCIRVSLGRVDNISPCTWEAKLSEHAGTAQMECCGKGELEEVIDGGNGQGEEMKMILCRVDYNPRSDLRDAMDSMHSPPRPPTYSCSLESTPPPPLTPRPPYTPYFSSTPFSTEPRAARVGLEGRVEGRGVASLHSSHLRHDVAGIQVSEEIVECNQEQKSNQPNQPTNRQLNKLCGWDGSPFTSTTEETEEDFENDDDESEGEEEVDPMKQRHEIWFSSRSPIVATRDTSMRGTSAATTTPSPLVPRLPMQLVSPCSTTDSHPSSTNTPVHSSTFPTNYSRISQTLSRTRYV